MRELAMVIIGVGNEYRKDDGAGLSVVRRLSAPELCRQLPQDGAIRLFEMNGEGASLMDAWDGADAVILIDAVRSGGDAGAIHRMDAHTASIPASFFNYSSHAFSVAEAIELARTLHRLPPQLVVYGIEGEDFDQGAGLSAAVESAVCDVATLVIEEARAMLEESK